MLKSTTYVLKYKANIYFFFTEFNGLLFESAVSEIKYIYV